MSFSVKLADLQIEELKGILNDEDYFEKFIMEAEADYEPLSMNFETFSVFLKGNTIRSIKYTIILRTYYFYQRLKGDQHVISRPVGD